MLLLNKACTARPHKATLLVSKPARPTVVRYFRPHDEEFDESGIESVDEASKTTLETVKAPDSGIVFKPFEEAQPQVAALNELLRSSQPGYGPTASLARLDYQDKIEWALNEQINVEYNMSYVYESLAAYFNRDDIGLPGFAAYFRQQSDEERGHAHKIIAFQSQRGGRVKLGTILAPETDYYHPEKGDALYAAELALSLEKLNFQKLKELHALASSLGDADVTQWIEGALLDDQSQDVKKAAVIVSQLRRVGRGHGVWDFDQKLQAKYGAVNGAAALTA